MSIIDNQKLIPVAREFLRHVREVKRPESADGRLAATYFTLDTDAPSWAIELIYDAHDGRHQDDWTWAIISKFAHMILDETTADLDFAVTLLCDSATPKLLRWAAEYQFAIPYADKVVAAGEDPRGDVNNLGSVLVCAQLNCIEDICNQIIRAFTRALKEVES